MKILVVEDKKMHRESAEQTLEGHELTIVPSYDEAMELLQPKIDYNEARRLEEAEGLKYPDREAPNFEDLYAAYRKRSNEIKKQCTPKVEFDVVLSDMMMPMSRQTLGRGVWNPMEQVPYGFIIALVAAKAGVKFIAVVTDTNHHQGAISAALDHISSANYNPHTAIQIEHAKVLFVHAPFLKEILPDTRCDECIKGVCPECKGELKRHNYKGEVEDCWRCKKHPGKCWNCEGTGVFDKEVYEKKDWGQVLKGLTEPASESDSDED